MFAPPLHGVWSSATINDAAALSGAVSMGHCTTRPYAQTFTAKSVINESYLGGAEQTCVYSGPG